MSKPILCIDFDGVLHSYTTKWLGADVIPDPPVPGAMEFLCEATNHFQVAIYSSRSGSTEGREAMRKWLHGHLVDCHGALGNDILDLLLFPDEKPPALVTLDDRAITFDGTWPAMDTLKNFKPWNRR